MTSWALCLPRPQSRTLAKLYDLPDVCVGEVGELAWARGTGTDREVENILARVPSSHFFEVVHGDGLLPRGRLLPTARLPQARWIPLRDWLVIDIPTPALPGELGTPAELRLVACSSRSGEELLLCRVDGFREFLVNGPLHRLRPLHFVVNDTHSDVLVRGLPLPSIPGQHFVLEAGIATPAGQAWSPPVGASVVRAWLGLREHTFAVWRADGGISEVDEGAFVRASRRIARRL